MMPNMMMLDVVVDDVVIPYHYRIKSHGDDDVVVGDK